MRRGLDFLTQNCENESLSQLVNNAEMKKKNGIWNENIHLLATEGSEEWPMTMREMAIPLEMSTQLYVVERLPITVLQANQGMLPLVFYPSPPNRWH